MSLPTGIWTMVTNGRVRTLEIRGVDEKGRVKAVMQNSSMLIAYWSECTKQLIMKRLIDPLDAMRHQEYMGYLHDIAEDSLFHNLAGTCTAINDDDYGGDMLGDRRVFGWFARLPREREDDRR